MPAPGPSGLRVGLLRAALLGLLVLTALGLRAGSPLRADDRRWQLNDVLHGGALLQAAAVLTILVVLVVVAVSVRGVGGSPARRSTRRTWLSLLVFGSFVALSVVLDHLSKAPPGQAAGPRAPQPARQAAHGVAAHQNTIAPVALLVLLAVVAVLAACVAARRRSGAHTVLDEPAPAFADGLAAAAEVLRARPADEPRTRVLAAYAAFEQTLAGRGLLRGRSGTATALLDRAVAAGASAVPARELTELFGAARYGATPVTQRDVDRAQQALDLLLSRA